METIAIVVIVLIALVLGADRHDRPSRRRGSDEAARSPGPPPSSAPRLGSGDWYFVRSGEAIGPIPASELRLLHRDGHIGARTLVWREGLDGWIPLEELSPPEGDSVAR